MRNCKGCYEAVREMLEKASSACAAQPGDAPFFNPDLSRQVAAARDALRWLCYGDEFPTMPIHQSHPS
jgi:molybdopterin-guanine dinucleotide biosynthesis protein A